LDEGGDDEEEEEEEEEEGGIQFDMDDNCFRLYDIHINDDE
jgi:hypothetical protein